MIHEELQKALQTISSADVIDSTTIQTLWRGYGEIARVNLASKEIPSVIVKDIRLTAANKHPKGWNTDLSHLRKLTSYEVEVEWYTKWAPQCTADCRVPKCYYAKSTDKKHLILLEDLDTAGFPIRRSYLNLTASKVGLKWLANFHATFMQQSPKGLWEQGSYWHLTTRPDEFKVMKEGDLKIHAKQLDSLLHNCSYYTIIHGDAKVANFCFSRDLQQVAAVDFQYVGGGCGMKDVAYFLGSCLSEAECDKHEKELLDYYFDCLKSSLANTDQSINFDELAHEWRFLYPFAWADFTRFLLGWSPSHRKLNSYSQKMVEQALRQLD